MYMALHVSQVLPYPWKSDIILIAISENVFGYHLFVLCVHVHGA